MKGTFVLVSQNPAIRRCPRPCAPTLRDGTRRLRKASSGFLLRPFRIFVGRFAWEIRIVMGRHGDSSTHWKQRLRRRIIRVQSDPCRIGSGERDPRDCPQASELARVTREFPPEQFHLSLRTTDAVAALLDAV